MKNRERALSGPFLITLAWGLSTACGAPAEPESKVIAVPPPPSEEPANVEDDSPPPTTGPTPDSSQNELGPLDRARVDNARAETASIAMAIELWQSSRAGTCPRYDDLIRDKVLPPDKPNEDPWGQPYSIECTDTGPTVISNGPDETRGTADDVTGSSS